MLNEMEIENGEFCDAIEACERDNKFRSHKNKTDGLHNTTWE